MYFLTIHISVNMDKSVNMEIDIDKSLCVIPTKYSERNIRIEEDVFDTKISNFKGSIINVTDKIILFRNIHHNSPYYFNMKDSTISLEYYFCVEPIVLNHYFVDINGYRIYVFGLDTKDVFLLYKTDTLSKFQTRHNNAISRNNKITNNIEPPILEIFLQ